MSLRQIADATDLSFQRVHQIIRRRIERFTQPAESIKVGAKPIPNSKPERQRRTDRSTRLRRVRERAKTEANQQKRDRKS